MRKTLKKTTKSDKLRKKALTQLRETRAKLLKDHPKLMQKMEILARRHIPQAQNEKPEDQHEKKSDLKVDKQKNISTILKYLEAQDPENPMKAAIKAILAKHLN